MKDNKSILFQEETLKITIYWLIEEMIKENQYDRVRKVLTGKVMIIPQNVCEIMHISKTITD